MTSEDGFELRLAGMRAKLHRFAARMTGSAVDGEDVVQEVLLKAVAAEARGERIENLEGWLFRVAHNASLDFLRARARNRMVELTDDIAAAGADEPQADLAAVGFRVFLELPALQRCAVVLKDVLGYSLEEIAAVAGVSSPAAKSALQRGRVRLRELAAGGAGAALLPRLPEAERRLLSAYVGHFRAGDFDAIRGMLAEEVRLELVNRLELAGRAKVAPYFTRYAEAKQWRYALGAVDGRPAMLVYDGGEPSERPAHFVLLDWRAGMVSGIRDFLFAPYAMEGADWVRLD